MLLKLKKKDKELAEVEDLSDRLRVIDQKNEFFQLSIRALLQFIKDFSLDIKEIKSEEFKNDINKLSDQFFDEPKLKKIQTHFEKDKKRIAAFIELQENYLKTREGELKDIIEILTNAMVALDTENQQYNQKVLAESEKIERITYLDDIKKIKQALIQEIEQIRATVKEKQTRDNIKLEILSKQVNTLNVQLERARTESLCDGLTGIYNRKAFDHKIGDLVHKNTVSRLPFSLLMIDIDDFKKINDTFGHQTGDRVIMAIANKCRLSIRSEDFLARYGGEEFVIILPGASLKNAVKKANHICKSIAATRYSLDEVHGSPTLSITVSIGVSSHQNADTIATVTQRADQALYAAKRAGKNRVLSEKDITRGA
ncbi:MAG: diguanylate cyclase [Desulfobacterales bacterium]|nr:MAG: diguanylate cyclase [Desulfobacterales bacterium]